MPRRFPGALVAAPLEYAVAELATFQGPRVTQILNDNIACAVVGDQRQPRHWPMPRPRPTPSWRDYRLVNC